LVETIAVTAVLLLISTIAAQNYVAIRRGQDERALAASIERLPTEARIEARRGGLPVALRTDGESLWLEQIPAEGDPAELRRVTLRGDVAVESTRMAGIDTDPGQFEWVVQPDGTSASADLGIRFGDRQRTLRLGRVGDARWSDGAIEDAPEESWPAGERVNRGS